MRRHPFPTGKAVSDALWRLFEWADVDINKLNKFLIKTNKKMSLELKGVIKKITDEVTGEGKNGTWKKRDLLVTYKDGDYEKDAAFTFFGDKVEKLDGANIGDEVTVKFNIESREHNDRLYTNLMAWYFKVESAVDVSSEENDMPF